MRYRLKEGLYHCIAGQNVVFLDLPKSRYFALSSVGTQTFRKLKGRNGETFAGVEEALSSLINAGYLLEATDYEPGFNNLGIEAPSGDVSRRTKGSFKLWPLLVALYSDLLASLRIRLSPLNSVLARSSKLARAKASEAQAIQHEIELWVSAFDRASLVLGRTNRCLARSLAMFSVLNARGVRAALVFGVRTEPFSAHAWVQYQDIVLNDTYEQINNYSPILVLQ